VGDWIDDVVSPAPAPRSSLALPAPGRLLVLADGSAWTVAEDGARRQVGAFSDATWSPGGLFVAAARGRELVALEPGGVVHWVRPAAGRVSVPRWSPDGFRIAYRSGSNLRVAYGDDRADWLVARSVAPLAPAWKPLRAAAEQVLAFATGDRLRIVEVDTGKVLGTTPPEPLPREIWWASRDRLVAVSSHSVRIHSASGRLLRTIDLPPITGSAVRPGGRVLAVTVRASGSRSALLLIGLNDHAAPPRRLLVSSRPFEGLAWSTDGSQIVVGRPLADQWLFVAPAGGVESVRGIRAKFDAAAAFPRPAGWCYPESTDRSPSGQPPCLAGSSR
jgi:hypothetical protein